MHINHSKIRAAKHFQARKVGNRLTFMLERLINLVAMGIAMDKQNRACKFTDVITQRNAEAIESCGLPSRTTELYIGVSKEHQRFSR